MTDALSTGPGAALKSGLQLSPQKLKTKCLEVLKVPQTHQHGWVFNSPVDPVELGLPDYFDVIKKPMDLGTIEKNLENGCYHSIDEFEKHVLLTFDNALLYNPEGSMVHNIAKEMKQKFQGDYEALIKQLKREEDARRKDNQCVICLEAEKSHAFLPCGHFCACRSCASGSFRRSGRCPICRDNSNSIQRIFSSEQQQPQQSQQHSPCEGLNGNWRSDEDVPERKKVIATIVHLLQQRKPDASQEWLRKLPLMAKRLEESLYRSAKSFDEYIDPSTLKQRLQQMAVNIGMKAKRMQQARLAQQQQQQQRAAATVVSTATHGTEFSAEGLHDPASALAPGSASSIANVLASAPSSGSQANANHQVSGRRQVLLHQQQRLLMLRHAANCKHEDGLCPVTPNCAAMKRLWRHMLGCSDQQCLVPHCVSSRFVLCHYHRCRDLRCPVCGPVHKAIHRAHETQMQLKALKQRHQRAVQQNQMASGSSGQTATLSSGISTQTAQPGAPASSALEPSYRGPLRNEQMQVMSDNPGQQMALQSHVGRNTASISSDPSLSEGANPRTSHGTNSTLIGKAHYKTPDSGENGVASAIGHCVICLESAKSHVFIPCGHLCACQTCASDSFALFRRCPICRENSSSIQRIFFS